MCFQITEWELGQLRVEMPLKKALELYNPEFEDDKDTIVIIDEIQEYAQIYNLIRTFQKKRETSDYDDFYIASHEKAAE